MQRPDRYALLSQDHSLATQGFSDKKCEKCGKHFWVNFSSKLICLSGCGLLGEVSDKHE